MSSTLIQFYQKKIEDLLTKHSNGEPEKYRALLDLDGLYQSLFAALMVENQKDSDLIEINWNKSIEDSNESFRDDDSNLLSSTRAPGLENTESSYENMTNEDLEKESKFVLSLFDQVLDIVKQTQKL